MKVSAKQRRHIRIAVKESIFAVAVKQGNPNAGPGPYVKATRVPSQSIPKEGLGLTLNQWNHWLVDVGAIEIPPRVPDLKAPWVPKIVLVQHTHTRQLSSAYFQITKSIVEQLEAQK